MNNTQRGFAATALLIVVGLAFITGGVYVYSKHKRDSADRDLIFSVRSAIRASEPSERAVQISADLAWAKARLQMETTKLNQLKAEASMAVDMNAVLQDAYVKVNNAVNVKTASIKLNNDQLTFKRDQIGQILNNWRNLLTNPTPENTARLRESLRVELPQVQQYFNSLTTTVNSLTPANSGLTQQQIDTYQTAVNEATQQVTTAVTNVTNAETQAQTSTNSSGTGSTSGSGSSSGSNSSGNSADDSGDETTVEEQQEIVDELEEEIEELEEEQEQVEQEIENQNGTGNGGTGTGSGTGSGSSSGTGGSDDPGNTGTTYVPPPVYNSEDGPQLIQGINPQ